MVLGRKEAVLLMLD